MILHPWHEVAPADDLTKMPSMVNGIVEIPRGSKAKYEIDKPSGLIKLDRVLHSSMCYPANYGFIPQTLFDDGDPLDIMVLTEISLPSLTKVTARVIGMMRMVDSGDQDDKILAVAVNDMSVAHIQNLSDLPQHFFDEMRNFFDSYKKLEGKTVTVQDFPDKEAAYQTIQYALDLYRKKFA